MTERRARVLIVGGGFAGLAAAKSLARAPADVILIDRRNHHLFQPLLYQVATAALSPADISAPIRSILRRQANCQVVMAEVLGADVERRRLLLRGGHVHYDYLILAAGATHSYFGHEEWAPVAPGLKSIEDATELRRRILLAFESAEYEGDEAARRAALTFAIVGAGPTGVELAGAIQEIAGRTIPRDYRHIDTTTTRVILFEGLGRVLPTFPPELSDRARRDLERMGVEVRLNAMVTGIEPGGIHIGEQFIPVRNVFWAAGVKANPLGESLGAPLDRAGRVIVEPDLTIPGHPELFVVGDLAAARSADTGDPVPGLAPAAIQMGRYAGRTIAAELSAWRGHPARDSPPHHPARNSPPHDPAHKWHGHPAPEPRPDHPADDPQTSARPPAPRTPFRYRDKGAMAIIGKARAVAWIGRFRFGGPFAWLLWGGVHIASLIGFRNRIAVLLSWFWNWLINARDSRLITGDARIDIRTPRPAEFIRDDPTPEPEAEHHSNPEPR